MAAARGRRLRTWLAGTVRGEFSTSGLDGLREAGGAAYSLADEAEGLRQAPGWDPWRQERTTQLFLVCAWNAFALQAVADHVLDLDADAAELAPATTLAFARRCYPDVTSWIERARFAQANPAYRVDVPLPTQLHAWPVFEQPRADHIRALRRAYDAIAPRAEYDGQRLAETAAPADARQLGEVRLLETQMQAAAELAARLGARAQGREQLAEVRDALLEALHCAYALGQVAAMPSLVERLHLAGRRADPSSPVAPAAVEVGWPVVDPSGTRIGTVARLEGEPTLGNVTGLVISLGAFSADRRVRLDQLGTVMPGLVRLTAGKADLEPV